MDDREFVRRLIGREAAAWERFVREYAPLIARAAAGVVGEEQAEDMAQRVCQLLLEGNGRLLRSFQGRSSLGTWLVAIARNQALLQRRGERRPEGPKSGAAGSPLEELVRAESAEQLAEAMAALAPRERLLLTLHYQDGLSHAQIAAVLGVSPNSVSPLLERARERLKKKSL